MSKEQPINNQEASLDGFLATMDEFNTDNSHFDPEAIRSRQEDNAWMDHRSNSSQTVRDAYLVKEDKPTWRGKRISRDEASQKLVVARLSGGQDDGSVAEYLAGRPVSDTEQQGAKSYHEELYDLHDDYESMGVIELAKRLADAELNNDKTTQSNLTDTLLGKLEQISEGFGDKEGASKHFADGGSIDPHDALLDRVMKYKDRYKEQRIIGATDSKIDVEVLNNWMTSLKNEGVPDEIIKQFPPTFFYKDGDPGQTDDIPESYKLWKAQQKASRGIDDSQTTGFTPFGRVLGDEDIKYYYHDNEEPDDEVADMGEGGVHKDEGLGDYIDDNQPTIVMPVTKDGLFKRLRSKLKEAWDAQPAVRFDGKDHNGNKVPGKKIGDAIVDADPTREYQARHKIVLVGLGVLAAGATYLATRGIDTGMHTLVSAHASGSGAKKGVDTGTVRTTAEQAKEIIQTFRVEKGHGYTHELMDFVNSRGSKISGDQAFRLHEHLMDKFGSDYIDIKGSGSDIYRQGSDVRLARAGQAQWAQGVQEEITKWLIKNN